MTDYFYYRERRYLRFPLRMTQSFVVKNVGLMLIRLLDGFKTDKPGSVPSAVKSTELRITTILLLKKMGIGRIMTKGPNSAAVPSTS